MVKDIMKIKIYSKYDILRETLIVSILLLGENILTRNNKRLSIATTHTHHIQGILKKYYIGRQAISG
jgi:hypothetical protein